MAGPLSRNPAHVGRWKCEACLEWYTSPPVFPWQDSHPHLFCSGCIVSQFDAALEFDFNWPASWGSVELNPQDFASILPPEIIAKLTWKRNAMAAFAASTTAQGVEGLVRGEDFQNCPQCHKPIHLEDGCNHMTCKCTASFCFRCGEFAEGRSNHWDAPDGCPRYGDTHLPHLDEPTREVEEPDLEEIANIRRMEVWRACFFQPCRWAYNVAMQRSGSSPDLALQRNVRQFTLPQTNTTVNYPAREHWRPVMHAMQAYDPRHGVSYAQWRRTLVLRLGERNPFHNLGSFLRGALFTAHSIDSAYHPSSSRRHIVSESGLLRQPIAGIFSLNLDEGRANAADWLTSRINVPEADWPRPNHPQNFAILAIGPRDDGRANWSAAETMALLSGTRLEDGTRIHFPQIRRYVSFSRVDGASTMLLHVYGMAEPDDNDEEDFEVLFTLHPRVPADVRDRAMLNWIRHVLTADGQTEEAIEAAQQLQLELDRPRLRILENGAEYGGEEYIRSDRPDDSDDDSSDGEYDSDYDSNNSGANSAESDGPDGGAPVSVDEASESEASSSDEGAPSPVIEPFDPKVETLDPFIEALHRQQPREREMRDMTLDAQIDWLAAHAPVVEAPDPEVEILDQADWFAARMPVVGAPDPEVETLDETTARREPTEEQFMADLQGRLALLNLEARDPQVRLAVLDVEVPNPRILLRGRLDEVIPARPVHGDRIARREQIPRQALYERQRAQVAALAARLDAFDAERMREREESM
jgi:hypothetical protein